MGLKNDSMGHHEIDILEEYGNNIGSTFIPHSHRHPPREGGEGCRSWVPSQLSAHLLPCVPRFACVSILHTTQHWWGGVHWANWSSAGYCSMTDGMHTYGIGQHQSPPPCLTAC